MKKAVVLTCVFVLSALLFTSCQRFKKICFSTESLGEVLDAHITENTSVIGSYELSVPKTVPMYSVSKRALADDEYDLLLAAMNLKEGDSENNIDRRDNGLLAFRRFNTNTPDYSFTDEETLRTAKEIFGTLPVVTGEYECTGINEYVIHTDSKGVEHIQQVGVSFRKLIDGIRVVGNDIVYLYFDNRGIAGIHLELFDYKRIDGAINLTSVDSAYARVKSPDSFDLKEENETIGIIDTLNVEKARLLMVNQYSNGCTVLQPVYSFSGTATDVEGKTSSFTSVVIAFE